MSALISILLMNFPYVYGGMFGLMLLLDIDSDTFLLSHLGISLALGILLSILYRVASRKGSDARLARQNLHVRIAQIPAFLLFHGFFIHRLAETYAAAANGAMGIGLSLFSLYLIMVPYWLSLASSQISGASLCLQLLRNKPLGVRLLHAIMHIVPILDIFSAKRVEKQVYPG